MEAKTKTGYSTAADVLEKLAPEYPIVAKILNTVRWQNSVDLCGWIGWFYSGRWRDPWEVPSDYYSDGTSQQRRTVCRIISGLNGASGSFIRKVFIRKDGFVFVDADYSQIELRILAHCSGDDMLINAYRQLRIFTELRLRRFSMYRLTR